MTRRWFLPLSRAVAQLADPPLLRVAAGSAALSALALGGFGAALGWALAHQMPNHAWLAGPLGGFAALLAAWWLFVPLAVVAGTLLAEPVARAVERRFYPGLPPPRGEGLAGQMREAIGFGALALAWNALALPLALLPGPGWLVGWAVAAWAVGRGLFVGVAMRRHPRPVALALYRARRTRVAGYGAALAALGLAPGANLLAPVLGTAIMVHVLEIGQPPRRSGRG